MADHRRHPELLAALRRIAPGTDLRHGMDDIIRGHLGALIVIGEPQELQFLFSGGLQLDHPFTPQFLYELAKMDGAIILNSDSSRIVCANVQLMPDPDDRLAARRAPGTAPPSAWRSRPARSSSRSRRPATPSRSTSGEIRYQLEAIADVLAKTNQAIATLETYSGRLEQVSSRLTALEFQSAVTLDDVLVVVQRAEMATRMGDEIERNVIELGREGWLIEMQLGELMRDIPRDRVSVIRDYEMAETTGGSAKVLRRLAGLSHNRLLDFEVLADCLGHGGVNPLDLHLRPRGYRALAQIPRLTRAPDRRRRGRVRRARLDPARVAARARGVRGRSAPRTARDIREGLRRLQEHNLMDRYLQL